MVSEAGTARRGEGWLRAGAALTTVLGVVTLVGGIAWLLINVHSPDPAMDFVVGAVFAAGGLVLLLPHRIELPAPVTSVARGVAAVVGTAAGLTVSTAQWCCEFAYVVVRGWPFHWLQRGALAQDPDTARRLAQDDSWHPDLVSLAMNVLFWAYVGMLIVVVAVLVRRGLRARDGRRAEAG